MRRSNRAYAALAALIEAAVAILGALLIVGALP
jgi:hypothetical protein